MVGLGDLRFTMTTANVVRGVFGEAPKTAGEAPAFPGCRDNTKSASRTGQGGKIFGWIGIVRVV